MRNFQPEIPMGGGAGSSSARPAAISDRIAANGFTMEFARNEEIFGEGEEADFVYRVVSGAVRTVRILSDGRRQLEAFFFPGDVFGLEDGEAHAMCAEAVSDCRVVLVRRTAIDRAAEQDVVAARALWAMAAADLRRLREHMLLLARRGAVERVATFLLEIDQRTRGCGQIDLPMSRTDIADYLGLTIETVSRSVTQLERDGLISLDGARRLRLLDRGALADCSA